MDGSIEKFIIWQIECVSLLIIILRESEGGIWRLIKMNYGFGGVQVSKSIKWGRALIIMERFAARGVPIRKN